jgi:hypothetical protein
MVKAPQGYWCTKNKEFSGFSAKSCKIQFLSVALYEIS